MKVSLPGSARRVPQNPAGWFGARRFWAPSSCPASGGGGGGATQNGFCTSFTGADSHAATNLVLHGMCATCPRAHWHAHLLSQVLWHVWAHRAAL